MTRTALEEVERIARRVGWSLRWKSAKDRAHPAFTRTELEIMHGRRMVTAEAPIVVFHADRTADDNGKATARETIARMVLDALPRRGAAAH